MKAAFEKIDWQKIGKPRLEKVKGLDNSGPKVISIARPNRQATPAAKPQQNQNENYNSDEDANMVTSTIVETKPSMDAAAIAAREMANEEKNKRSAPGAPANNTARRRGRDLSSGMDLLDLDFLLSVVEETHGDAENEVTMRKLAFDDLTRRNMLHEIDSCSLKVYAMDIDGLYGKDIQCEALKELSVRTTHNGKRSD